MSVFVMIKTARRTLAQWRELPDGERARLQAEADAVRRLTVELAGPSTVALLGKGAPSLDAPAGKRDRAIVLSELKSAVGTLSAAVGTAAGRAAHESSRTVRIGTKVAKRFGKS